MESDSQPAASFGFLQTCRSPIPPTTTGLISIGGTKHQIPLGSVKVLHLGVCMLRLITSHHLGSSKKGVEDKAY